MINDFNTNCIRFTCEIATKGEPENHFTFTYMDWVNIVYTDKAVQFKIYMGRGVSRYANNILTIKKKKRKSTTIVTI